MDGVAGLECASCGNFPVEVHHCGTGGGGRRNHMKVAPLCFDCHRGGNSIDKQGKNRRFIEAEYLAYVAEHCPCNKCKKERS